MGLFSNLLGNSGREAEKAVNRMRRLAEDMAVDYAVEEAKKNIRENHPDYNIPSDSRPILNSSVQADSTVGPSGDSWGPVMPSEENQFNSGLSYQDYFSNVFNENFAQYQISKENPKGRHAAVYTFTQAGSTKLVVEVISKKSSPYKIRRDCKAQGIPYLRFYYDNTGWWNTKSYVTRRVSGALGI